MAAAVNGKGLMLYVTGISEASVQLQQPKLAPNIRAGGKVELRCHVDGSGELKYEWFRYKRYPNYILVPIYIFV